MAINHKFKQVNFGDGFETEQAILKPTKYSPEILIVGTFNPLTDDVANPADFFYGRNWFWPCMFNIMEHQEIVYKRQRRFTLKPNYDPTVGEIKNFCKKFKLTFADLISSVLHDNIEYELIGNNAFINNEGYNLIKDSHLAELNNINQIEWTTNHLTKYILETKTIKTVYFTRKPIEPYETELNVLKNYDYGREVIFKNIFTPSGQGLKGRPRIEHLIHHWLFNDNPDYDIIENDWLLEYNINKQIFFIQ